MADQLGHRDIRMTMRYAHLSAAHRADAVGKLDGVFDFMGQKSVPKVSPENIPTQALAVTSSK